MGQAVAFSIAHVIAVRLPWTFLFGLALGWLRVRTGSLWTGMAVHFLLNGAAAAWMWAGADLEVAWWWWLPGLIGLGVVPLFAPAAEAAEPAAP